MPKVRDVRIGLWPELLKEQADKEMQKLKEIVQGRMSEGMKKAGQAARNEVTKIKNSTKSAMGHGGILGIIKEIQAAIQAMRGDVEAMTGIGGTITDIAYALGTSEERLMQTYHAFGQAGMGSTQVIDEMLQQFQGYVAQKEGEGFDVLEGRDTLTAFLDMLRDLEKMSKEQQDALIAEVFGSKKVFGMQKLLGSWAQARENLTNADVRTQATTQAEGARAASSAGDTIEYIQNSNIWQRMAIYAQKDAYTDVIDVTRSEEEDMTDKARKLSKGDILDAYNIASVIDEIKNLLINLPMSIIKGLKDEVPEPEGAIAKGLAKVFPWAGTFSNVIGNIGGDIRKVAEKMDTMISRGNSTRGDI